MNSMKYLFAALSMMALNTNASAADENNYLGASLSLSSIKTNTTTERGLGMDGIIGHNFNKYIGAEANVGAVNVGNNKISGYHFGASAVGNLPMGDSGIGLYAKYGYAYSSLGNSLASSNGTGSVYGAGAAFTQNGVSIRAGYEAYDYGNITTGYKGDGFVLQMLSLF